MPHLNASSCKSRVLVSTDIQCRRLVSDNVSYKIPISYNVNDSEVKKKILDPHPYPNQHQNLTTSRGSPLTHAYHVWSTSIHAFVSYIVHSPTDRQTSAITIQHRIKYKVAVLAFKSRSSDTSPTHLSRHIKARVSERILRSSAVPLYWTSRSPGQTS